MRTNTVRNNLACGSRARRAWIWLVVLQAVFFFAVPGARAGVPRPAHRRPTTLTVWVLPTGPGDAWGNFVEAVKPYTDAHPEIALKGVAFDWLDGMERIREGLLKGGPAPDLIMVGTTWVAPLAMTGMLADLTDVYDGAEFVPAILATTEVADEPALAGKRFALPWFVDSRALFYNKAYCRRVGVDPDRDFATWDSFHAALRKLSAIRFEGAPIAPLGISLVRWNLLHNLAPWIWGGGGGFVGTSLGDPVFDSQGTLDGLLYMASLAREGLLSEKATQIRQSQVLSLLENGEIAVSFSKAVSTLPENAFGIAPLPAGPHGRFTFLGGAGFAVPRRTQHPAQAKAFLRFLSSEGAQVRNALINGGLPASVGQYDDLLLRLDPVRSAFISQLHLGRAYRSLGCWGDIEPVLRDGLRLVWESATKSDSFDPSTIRTILRDTQAAIDGILRRKQTGGAPVRRPGAR